MDFGAQVAGALRWKVANQWQYFDFRARFGNVAVIAQINELTRDLNEAVRIADKPNTHAITHMYHRPCAGHGCNTPRCNWSGYIQVPVRHVGGTAELASCDTCTLSKLISRYGIQCYFDDSLLHGPWEADYMPPGVTTAGQTTREGMWGLGSYVRHVNRGSNRSDKLYRVIDYHGSSYLVDYCDAPSREGAWSTLPLGPVSPVLLLVVNLQHSYNASGLRTNAGDFSLVAPEDVPYPSTAFERYWLTAPPAPNGR